MKFVEKLSKAMQDNNSLLCVGLDTDPKRMPETVPVHQWGGRVVTIELSEGHSTSGLISRIQALTPSPSPSGRGEQKQLKDSSDCKSGPRGTKRRGEDDEE